MRSVPLCVIGGGAIGMRHIGCALDSDAVTLTAVVEADPTRRATLRGQGLPVVATTDEVPQHTRAAIVATPTPDHAATALRCLQHGWAMLVEKPLTDTIADAQTLCDQADALGLPLRVGHHRRCHPFVLRARAMLADLGPLVLIQGLWSLRKHDSYYDIPWRRSVGAGPILTNLSHEIDLLRLLAGEITDVSALTSNTTRGFEIEDTTALTLRLATGALASIAMSDAGASPWAFEAATGENPAIHVRGPDPVRFIGTQGALSFPSLQRWHASAGNPADWQHPLAQESGPDMPRVDAIAVQLDRFAALADGGTDDILATGRDGLRTSLVLDAVIASARSGQSRRIAP
jgi:predicted dehydrogenase